jgi:hypothetical protein
MSRRKHKNIVSEKTTQFFIPTNNDSTIEKVKSNLGSLTEGDFLNAYRLLKTYKERSEALEKRGYVLNESEMINSEHFYSTITVNLKSEVETWYKRKPFSVIKKELLSHPNIVSENPYTEFTIFDDNGNPHTFYKKN